MECDKSIWDVIQREFLGAPFFIGGANRGLMIPVAIDPFSIQHQAPKDKGLNDPDNDAEKFGNPKITDLVSKDNSVWDELLKYADPDKISLQ